MKVNEIPISEITARGRLRGLDPDWVAAIADAIEEEGLLHPIVVSRKGDEGFYHLVVGAHRLAAFKRLKRTKIPAHIHRGNKQEQRLLEIDENLYRRELSQLDRAGFLIERKKIYEALHPETKHGGDRGNQHTGGRQNDKLSFCQNR